MNKRKDAIKTLIELAESVVDADAIICKYTDCTTVREKIVYLSGLFDVTVVARESDDLDDDYWAILSTIINDKWR